MACFLVPAAEAIVTTVAAKVIERKEKNGGSVNIDNAASGSKTAKTPFSGKLRWLNTMLWGGSALLLLEHVWHGEVVPWFPFLTAAANAEDAAAMLREMATAGVGMGVLVTLVWAGMVAVSSAIEKRADKKQTAAERES